MIINTVQDLIDELQKVENKNLPIRVFNNGTEPIDDCDIAEMWFIDETLTDRVDINITKC